MKGNVVYQDAQNNQFDRTLTETHEMMYFQHTGTYYHFSMHFLGPLLSVEVGFPIVVKEKTKERMKCKRICYIRVCLVAVTEASQGWAEGAPSPPPPLGPNFWVIPCSCPSFFNYRCSGRTPTSTKLQRIPCSCPSFLTIDTVEELHLKVEECDF